ncbi:enoyl-CoA hydratase/isomerase [Pantoea sp. AS-PWVM4]|uniref:enoyl-CoA hydratase/isomerase family protein n=1 Tax=Pantoea sp. AS-PWVM4 TaxID=1332069 RepID=UPI0003AC82C7|nr:enoyl-CoA hydratase/isomerase family protein [Pantoea sp. AS-PWVM4]ERK16290.1 enoyl-CoA hydratase/isomerase [Pantoea sp. AS-PWVM4]
MTLIRSMKGDILTLSLNRPEADNRLSPEMVHSLLDEYRSADPLKGGPAVIILKAEGSLFSLGRQRPAQQSADPADIVAEFSLIQSLNEAVQNCRAVTITAIHGQCEGAALSLASRADIVLIAEEAEVSFPEIPHGIPPTIVLSHYRYVLSRHILGDLIFTGRVLSGAEAVQFGLAARVVKLDELQTEVEKVAGLVAGYDRRSIALVKSFLAQTEDLPRHAAPALGISLYANEISHRQLTRP